MSNKRKTDQREEEIKRETPETELETEIKAEAEGEGGTAGKSDGTQVPNSEAQEETPEKKLQKALDDEKDRFLRLAAEYDNFRKRTQKEREGLYSEVKAETVMSFLPVYDNLERALGHETADEAFYKGVEMIMTGFREIMTKLGVTEIPALGETFDPQFHNAVMHVEDESKGAGEIVEELQKGFKLGDRVIRFTLVKVAN